MAIDEIDTLIDKVMDLYGYKSEAELARSLGMLPQNFNQKKKRGTIERVLKSLIEKKNISQTIFSPTIHSAPQGYDDSYTMREIIALHKKIHDIEAEIGRIKDRLLDAAVSGDIKRLTLITGGKK